MLFWVVREGEEEGIMRVLSNCALRQLEVLLAGRLEGRKAGWRGVWESDERGGGEKE